MGRRPKVAKDLNKVMIIGNCTRDPELRYTPNGQPVANIGVATNRSWSDQNSGDRREEVEFHDVVVWGKLAEICGQILAKGRRVYFEGRLQTRQWEAQDGSKRRTTEIVAQDMIVLDKPPAGMGYDASEGVQTAPADESQAGKPAKKTEKKEATKEAAADEINIEDIPF
jgi:single-strand DNA-binding protein